MTSRDIPQITPLGVSASFDEEMLKRPDISVDHGQFALLNTGLTPAEATRDDLLFVRSVLETAGLDYLLVRGADDRPVIAIDRADRKVLRRALAAACATEPFYSQPATGTDDKPATSDAPAVLLASGKLSAQSKVRAFTLYRPRVEAAGGLRYGADAGVDLELWEYQDDLVVAPRPNRFLRRHTPRHELVADTALLHGLSWPTIAGMFAPQADDIRFDVDIVFSWVDGAQLEWQRARALRMESYVVGEGDDHEARFRQLDELKYALRSVHIFAPWIRNIFIVTDSPRPAWLAEHPRVKVLTSEEFFADTSVLPTHNSHAIESQLHNIEGLSEHFLYSNDDMFFGRPVGPEMFFSSGGVSKFIEAPTRIGPGSTSPQRSGFENAARVNRALLLGRFGAVIARHLEHAAAPLRVSVLRELEAEFPEDFARTAASAFRQATDISVTNSLYHYYALLSGRAVVQTDARVRYVDTTSRRGLKDMRRLLSRRAWHFFCLNDGSFPELSAEERAEAVRSFLEHYYPIVAPWEIEPS